MKTYEELLSDIEDDIELMGASHIVYSMEENNIITDYDYLPSDSCNISTTLKDLQGKYPPADAVRQSFRSPRCCR